MLTIIVVLLKTVVFVRVALDIACLLSLRLSHVENLGDSISIYIYIHMFQAVDPPPSPPQPPPPCGGGVGGGVVGWWGGWVVGWLGCGSELV